MRILAISDLHGEVAWVPGTLDHLRPDLLLCAGDWGDPGQVSEAQYRSVIERVHVLSVYGNHDDRELLGRLRNADGSPVLLAQGEAREVRGLVLAGISGIWAKTKLGSRLNAQWETALRRDPALTLDEWAAGCALPPYVTDDEVASLSSGLAGRGVDILITHACPLGIGDRTPSGRPGGQRSFREALEAIQPRVHLCGHIHRLQRTGLPGGRAVLNAGHGALGEGWLLNWANESWDATPLAPGNFSGACSI